MVRMTRHVQTVLARMRELLAEYDAGRADLRRLVDDLRSMYESLPPEAGPDERAWNDAFIPLDRILVEDGGRDNPELDRRIRTHLAQIAALLSR